MITNEQLRCIERATCQPDAIASMGRNEEGEILKVATRGRECLVRIDRPFSENPSLAVAIVRHLLHSLQIDLADKALKDLKRTL